MFTYFTQILVSSLSSFSVHHIGFETVDDVPLNSDYNVLINEYNVRRQFSVPHQRDRYSWIYLYKFYTKEILEV